ncbi:hypothetical protein ASPWEDRAFT_114947 [Aspergillus wentii DTO 134E9]|uniref:Uncharacterized protein n=1 Tax=Aspergillus wentii DTO 134E9 TaxID=1073089 RepID=A0A1L9RD01_ASPWE|nr:uncharacterized protein ASPWEDRAFT_114947 [Aspergillus wentii DTO 134E9]OJJ32782.1 hypothetical protein ASPWEDRAFT_114947 [Aspergillus wentii DTO 134E9]
MVLGLYQLALGRYGSKLSILDEFRAGGDGYRVELVFAATRRSNMSWVGENLPGWRWNIYRVDDEKAELTVPVNKGNEAMVYLTYLIDRYSTLPEMAVFMHDGRYQWHNDNPLYDSVISIQNLNFTFVKSTGYVNLRCSNILGCPAELEPARYLRERPNDFDHPTAMEFPNSFMELFPGRSVPEKVGTPCCSQFAVSREVILRRPVEEYIRYREWLVKTDLPSDITGRIFEYLWHMIFGKPAQSCPDERACYCQTYGLCKLSEEEVGEQWTWRGLDLPENWPDEMD